VGSRSAAGRSSNRGRWSKRRGRWGWPPGSDGGQVAPSAAALAGSALLGGGAAVFASTASGTAAGGPIRVFVDVDVHSPTIQPIVVTGAVGDFGTAFRINLAGKIDVNGNYVRMLLTKGKFRLNTQALNAKIRTTVPVLNPVTCSSSDSVTAVVRVLDGTGLYAGIGGTVKMTETEGSVYARLASGACVLNRLPISHAAALTGLGTVTF
jgi:hypothetical protein